MLRYLRKTLPIIAIFIVVLVFSVYRLIQTNGSIESIKKKTSSITRVNDYSTLNPHADMKMFILSNYPSLHEQAKLIRQPSDFSELRTLIYHHYILEEHDKIFDIINHYSLEFEARRLITVLSFLYLLPAHLYEKLGFADLATTDYNRFLLSIRQAANKYDYFTRRDVRNRIKHNENQT